MHLDAIGVRSRTPARYTPVISNMTRNDNLMHVRVLGLQIDPTSGSSIILLCEHDSPSRVLPIFIGPAEAQSIAIVLQGVKPRRPLTHDLCIAALAAVDVHIAEVAIVAIRAQTFIAEIHLDTHAGTERIDARPSDGIALALRANAPVIVDDDVFDTASVTFTYDPDRNLDDDEIDQIVTEFRRFLESAEPEDFANDLNQSDEQEPPQTGDTDN